MVPRFLAEILKFLGETDLLSGVLKGFKNIMWKDNKSENTISTIHSVAFFQQKSISA